MTGFELRIVQQTKIHMELVGHRPILLIRSSHSLGLYRNLSISIEVLTISLLFREELEAEKAC